MTGVRAEINVTNISVMNLVWDYVLAVICEKRNQFNVAISLNRELLGTA